MLLPIVLAVGLTNKATTIQAPTFTRSIIPNSGVVLGAAAVNSNQEEDGGVGVSLVSICTGDLCRCQEEGMNADAILQDLLSRNLPYPIEESVCLGACGPAAMVAIDFDDGSYALVEGPDETLAELGLEKVEQTSTTAAVPADDEIASVKAVAEMEEPAAVLATTTISPTTTRAQEEDVSATHKNAVATVTSPDEPVPEEEEFGDARDRMRAEAASDVQSLGSPWANAASYLAKKAAEKIFG